MWREIIAWLTYSAYLTTTDRKDLRIGFFIFYFYFLWKHIKAYEKRLLLGWPIPCTSGSPIVGWENSVWDRFPTSVAYILSYHKRAALSATSTKLHSDFSDFDNGVCHVMKIAAYNPVSRGLATTPNCRLLGRDTSAYPMHPQLIIPP